MFEFCRFSLAVVSKYSNFVGRSVLRWKGDVQIFGDDGEGTYPLSRNATTRYASSQIRNLGPKLESLVTTKFDTVPFDKVCNLDRCRLQLHSSTRNKQSALCLMPILKFGDLQDF
jgi:hypothetical protein